jgi:hypothetical protein
LIGWRFNVCAIFVMKLRCLEWRKYRPAFVDLPQSATMLRQQRVSFKAFFV